jgi:hypothetical protein
MMQATRQNRWQRPVEKKKMFRNPYFLGVFCLTVPPVYSIDLLAQLTDLHSSEVYAPIFS